MTGLGYARSKCRCPDSGEVGESAVVLYCRLRSPAKGIGE